MKHLSKVWLIALTVALAGLASGCVYEPVRHGYGPGWVPAHWGGYNRDVWVPGHYR